MYEVLCVLYTRSWLRSLHHANGELHENLFFIISLFLSLHSVWLCAVKVVIVSAKSKAKQEIKAIKKVHLVIACARLNINEVHFTARSNRVLFLFAVTMALHRHYCTAYPTTTCDLPNCSKLFDQIQSSRLPLHGYHFSSQSVSSMLLVCINRKWVKKIQENSCNCSSSLRRLEQFDSIKSNICVAANGYHIWCERWMHGKYIYRTRSNVLAARIHTHVTHSSTRSWRSRRFFSTISWKWRASTSSHDCRFIRNCERQPQNDYYYFPCCALIPLGRRLVTGAFSPNALQLRAMYHWPSVTLFPFRTRMSNGWSCCCCHSVQVDELWCVSFRVPHTILSGNERQTKNSSVSSRLSTTSKADDCLSVPLALEPSNWI